MEKKCLRLWFPRVSEIFLSLEFLRTNLEQKMQFLIPHSPFSVMAQNTLGQSDCRDFKTLLSQEINVLFNK